MVKGLGEPFPPPPDLELGEVGVRLGTGASSSAGGYEYLAALGLVVVWYLYFAQCPLDLLLLWVFLSF